jgi:phage FluMu protein Com
MAIEFRCTGCHKLLRSDDDAAGKKAQCPECGVVATVPNAPGTALDSSNYPPVRAVTSPPHVSSANGLPPKPSKVTAMGIMFIVGGVIAASLAISDLIIACFLCFTSVFAVYEIILAVLAITKGVRLLGASAYAEPPPNGIAVMQIVNVIHCDFANLAMGIVNLVFCNDPEVRAYLHGR